MRRLPQWALAAGIALVVLGALYNFRGELSGRRSYSTRIGAVETIQLTDRSRIILNTNSAIRVALTAKQRRIELQHGEAYFDVAKDTQRPFVVQVGSKQVVAVGTAFSIRRIGDDIQVAVAQGSVSISPSSSSAREVAGAQSPGVPAVVGAGSVARALGAKVQVRATSLAQIEQSLSWRNGLLVFHNTPLAEAVAELNRYNTRQVQIEDPAIGAMQIGGVFRSTNVEPFVQVLEHGFPIHATMEDGRILLESTH